MNRVDCDVFCQMSWSKDPRSLTRVVSCILRRAGHQAAGQPRTWSRGDALPRPMCLVTRGPPSGQHARRPSARREMQESTRFRAA